MSDPVIVASTPPADDRHAAARERMQQMQEKMREMRAAGWKPVILNPVQAAEAKPGSLKLAIKAMCWTCCGAGADPGTKFMVRDCTVKCPLYRHRPWQDIKGGITYGADGERVATDDTEDTNEGAED